MTDDNPYDPEFAEMIGGYPAGTVVRSDSDACRYYSTVDNNSEDPNLGSDQWRTLPARRTKIEWRRYGRLFIDAFVSEICDWKFYAFTAASFALSWLFS